MDYLLIFHRAALVMIIGASLYIKNQGVPKHNGMCVFDIDDTMRILDSDNQFGDCAKFGLPQDAKGAQQRAISAINECHRKGYKIAVCTKENREDVKKSGAIDFLSGMGSDMSDIVNKWLTSPACTTNLMCDGDYDAKIGKKDAMRKLQKINGITNKHCMLLFDNRSENIDNVTSDGYKGVLVGYHDTGKMCGISPDQLKKCSWSDCFLLI